ncbi:MAG: hypothetical protein ACTHN7_03200 [Solirubrobacterales bacterium]
MDRKLDVGATLREVFETYRDQAGVLLPVAFWLFLVVAIVNGLTAEHFSLFWVGLIVGLAVGTLYQGMVVGLVSDVQDGRRDSSVGELMRFALPVLGPLLGAGILAGIGIGFGFVLFVVPGLYLATIWAVIAPAIVIERRGVFDAFGRSRQLVKGNGWPVLWTVVVAYLIAFVVSIALAALANSIASGPLIRIVFNALASTVTAPITALVAAVLYFKLLPVSAAADQQPPEQSAGPVQ